MTKEAVQRTYIVRVRSGWTPAVDADRLMMMYPVIVWTTDPSSDASHEEAVQAALARYQIDQDNVMGVFYVGDWGWTSERAVSIDTEVRRVIRLERQ